MQHALRLQLQLEPADMLRMWLDFYNDVLVHEYDDPNCEEDDRAMQLARETAEMLGESVKCIHPRRNDHGDACLDCNATYFEGRWQ